MYIPRLKENNPEKNSIKRFINFNESDDQLYDNIFLDDYKIVIKVPIPQKPHSKDTVKIERFSIINDIFLTSY